jgi:pimeloyl-ACP methyl ester carboxylesterase
MATSWSVGAAIADEPVTAIGHSLGGYTVLCLAGGEPWTRTRELIEVPPDPRIGALVLFATAGLFSFLGAFPPAMHNRHFAPAQDPSGFDRERFQQTFPTAVLQWIRERRGKQGVGAET